MLGGLPEPVVITEHDLLGRTIIKVLQETRSRRHVYAKEDYTDRITVHLTQAMEKRSPALHRLLNVNVELDNAFQEALCLWIKGQGDAGLPANQACKNFLAQMRIDESEYTYDAAYKAWQRFNERLRKKHRLEVS
jgi:hypothetical protein